VNSLGGRITVLLLATTFLLPLSAPAQEEEPPLRLPRFSIGLLAGQYLAADELFKEVYGSGGLVYGASLGFDFYRTEEVSIGAVFEARRFTCTGASTYSATETKIGLTPLSLGIEVRLTRPVFGIWLGGGLDYISYRENSTLQTTKGSTSGLHVAGGLIIQIPAWSVPALKLAARWTRAKTTENGILVDLGGVEYGAALLFRFVP